jgi:hypothetical protein
MSDLGIPGQDVPSAIVPLPMLVPQTLELLFYTNALE